MRLVRPLAVSVLVLACLGLGLASPARADGPSRIDPGKPLYRILEQAAQLVEVVVDEGLGQPGPQGLVVELLGITVSGSGARQAEEHVKGSIEGRPVPGLFHHGGPEGGPQGL